MKFPLIKDVATTDVVAVDISISIYEALETMVSNNHRNVIVRDGDIYKILTVIDVLKLQRDNKDLNKALDTLELAQVPVISVDKNVLDTLEYLNNTVEYICALNNDNSLYGLITHTDITSHIDPHTLMDNYRLSDFLKIGQNMKQVSRCTKVSDLLYEIIEGLLDNVIVVEDKKPIGILTTKDLILLIKQKISLDSEVYEFMSSPVDVINKESSVKDALEFVKKKHYKRVVVVDSSGELAGVILQKELISLTYSKWATLMKEYQEELHELNSMLENKNLEFETIASTDSLTGLYNRYKFSELYISSYTSMIQRHNDMALILIDIDYFKKVNDTYGHNVGDKVLVQVAHTILKTLRNIDIVARWGGEEFVVLLPTANSENAKKIAEDLRLNVEQTNIDTAGGVTISVGVTNINEGDDIIDVINRADKALYEAKNSGRNCVKTQDDI